jgi:hypothetical protein
MTGIFKLLQIFQDRQMRMTGSDYNQLLSHSFPLIFDFGK